MYNTTKKLFKEGRLINQFSHAQLFRPLLGLPVPRQSQRHAPSLLDLHLVPHPQAITETRGSPPSPRPPPDSPTPRQSQEHAPPLLDLHLVRPPPGYHRNTPLLSCLLWRHLENTMPPQYINIPSKHIHGTIWLWAGDNSLCFSVLKCRVTF